MIKALIALVDDDESVRRTTTFLIESFGFQAAAFESADYFLTSGQLHNTACLVADVHMPGMTGFELQNKLASKGLAIPIIFITANDSKESRQQAKQAGAAAFLGKPFRDEELLESIRFALRKNLEETKDLVAVVDDDESIRRTTTLLIESFGLRTAVFDSAEDFLKSAEQLNPSCLILDLRMPNMNGLQLQRELAAAGCSIPVIFVTAYDDNESRGRAMQAGAVAFLGKPFKDEQLLEAVRSALGLDSGNVNSAG